MKSMPERPRAERIGTGRAVHDALLRLANQIDERLGPISGPPADRIAETMRRAAGEYEERVGELLAANNREVERRRAVEAALRGLLAAVESADHHGIDEDLYQAAQRIARAALKLADVLAAKAGDA